MIYSRSRASFVLPFVVNLFVHIWYIRQVLFDQQDDDYSLLQLQYSKQITVIINLIYIAYYSLKKDCNKFIIQYKFFI